MSFYSIAKVIPLQYMTGEIIENKKCSQYETDCRTTDTI